ncbi:MAG: hypothetical protein PUC15_00810, partial [Lentisphaeria bacterium]|nr:hypothetical protein [Lentisphaeria bacterium]
QFTRGVYGGIKATSGEGESSSPVNRDIDLSIEGGVFDKIVVGGNNIAMPDNGTSYYVTGNTQSVRVSNGLFKGAISGGDRFEKGVLNRNGNIDLSISGGTFTYRVAGGMMNAVSSVTDGHAFINGNISMTITGGNFTEDCWIYGGCVSTKKDKSQSALTTINGSVTITVDATASPITLCTIIVGSHGWGTITGDAKLVFTGSGDDILFNPENGDLWGSCSGDSENPITKKRDKTSSALKGDGILSFTGFTGKLDSTDIRGFSKIEIKNLAKTEPASTVNSTVILDNEKFNLSGVENWEFDCGSTLSGDFTNDFTGDTLKLVGFTSGTYTLITDSNTSDDSTRNVFNGFGSLAGIQLDETPVSITNRSDTAIGWDGGSLALVDGTDADAGKRFMILTLS